jgi:hypothetical protein
VNFHRKQTVKFLFGGRTTAIVALDLTYHLVERPASSNENASDVDANNPSCCSGLNGQQNMSTLHYVVASTGTPIIQETRIVSEASTAPSSIQLAEFAPMNSNSISLNHVASSTSNSEVPTTLASTSPFPALSLTNSAVLVQNSDDSSASLAQHAVTRDTGFVPLISAYLEYQPLCCQPRLINRIVNSIFYKIVFLVCSTVICVVFVAHPANMLLGDLYMFIPFMSAAVFYMTCELAQLDRTLLRYLMRNFDFWFLLCSLVIYLFLSFYQNAKSPNFCYNDVSFTQAFLTSLCSNTVFFCGNIFTFIWDAAPFVGRYVKIGLIVVSLANSLFLIYSNRLSGLYVVCVHTIDLFIFSFQNIIYSFLSKYNCCIL